MSAVPRIPITHSILRADALAPVIAETYDLDGPVHCELLARGVNEVYLVRSGGIRYAARVLRHNLRTRDQMRYETALIRFHASRGVEVSAPVATNEGEGFFTVRSLEGDRHVSLFTWADGGPMTVAAGPGDAHRLGALVAGMHLAVGSFTPPVAIDVDSPTFMAQRLPALLSMVGRDSEAGRLYARLVQAVSERLRTLDLPRGACHGDIHTHNVFLATDGKLTLIDWDNCGADFLAKELMHFIWRNDYLDHGRELNAPFLDGYESVRPLSDAERTELPFFLTVRHLFILCGMAGMVNIVGRSAVGYQHQLARFEALIQESARQAGLI